MFELDLERRKIEIRKKAQNPENPKKTLSARPNSQRPSSLGPSARPSARLTGPAPPRPASLSTARFASRLAPLRTAHPAQASSPSAQVAPHRLTARPHLAAQASPLARSPAQPLAAHPAADPWAQPASVGFPLAQLPPSISPEISRRALHGAHPQDPRRPL